MLFPISTGAALRRQTAKDPVVLMPCSAGSPRQWANLIQQLEGFEPATLELTGHGCRERWHGVGPMTLLREAEAIDRAVEPGARFHLVGHSYSGAVALRYALENPHRLLTLTLVEPSAFHVLNDAEPREAHLMDEIRALSEAVNRGVISGDYRGGMQTFIDYWGGPDSWRELGPARQTRAAEVAGHVAHHFWSLIEEPTRLAAYASIDVPTLILAGTRSPKPARAITRLLAGTLPNARHRTVRDAGHMAPLTHPAQVNAEILVHLLAHRSRPGELRAFAEAAE